jgi:truncated hemoglobin YjbI
MEHRRFLAHPEAHRAFIGSDVLRRVGGTAAVEALIDGLYDRLETDGALRPLFGGDLAKGRETQKRFFVEWLGGEGGYSSTTHLPLKHRHDLLPITRELAGKWLAHFRDALDIAVTDVDARRVIYEKVQALGLALVNESEPHTALRARSHGACLRYKPAVHSIDLVRRGHATALRELLAQAPDILASAPHAAKLLRLAVFAGRMPVVELLLDQGVDVNKPSPLPLHRHGSHSLIFVTPFCAARFTRKDTEVVLLRHGAKEDSFTHAFLGELEALEISR